MDGRIPTGQKRLATGAGGIARPIGTAMRVTHTPTATHLTCLAYP